MIEELKLLLDQMQNVPDVALWILGGFMGYKIITYLSTAGSIIFIVKLLCKTAVELLNKPVMSKLANRLIGATTEEELKELFTDLTGHNYIHTADIRLLRELLRIHKEKKPATPTPKFGASETKK